METRALLLMLLVLVAGSSGVAAEYIGLSPSQCQVPAKVRVDCGYPSVTKEQCNNRGCCFDSSIPNVPWCFKPLLEKGQLAASGWPFPEHIKMCSEGQGDGSADKGACYLA
nr:trefoil factor 3 [Meriones unguiculatus]